MQCQNRHNPSKAESAEKAEKSYFQEKILLLRKIDKKRQIIEGQSSAKRPEAEQPSSATAKDKPAKNLFSPAAEKQERKLKI